MAGRCENRVARSSGVTWELRDALVSGRVVPSQWSLRNAGTDDLSTIIPAPTVAFVRRSIRMKAPVARFWP